MIASRRGRRRTGLVSARRQAGFNIIELMVTIVVLIVLATVALPAYQDSILRSGRTAAKGALMEVVMRQEQHFLNNRGFSTNLTDLGLPDPYFVDMSSSTVDSADAERVYKITLADATASSYSAVATPVREQTEDVCGAFQLSSEGVRSVSGAAGSDICW